jgi:hypothetical protein
MRWACGACTTITGAIIIICGAAVWTTPDLRVRNDSTATSSALVAPSASSMHAMSGKTKHGQQRVSML